MQNGNQPKWLEKFDMIAKAATKLSPIRAHDSRKTATGKSF